MSQATHPHYTAADCHFGCSVPAYHPDGTDCSAENPCGCGPDAAWRCMNCGAETKPHRFCSRCEALIAADLAEQCEDLGNGWHRVAA